MNIHIRPLRETDLPEADRIFRLAFGTFLGLPDPLSFAGDADYVRSRWRANPSASLGAFVDGELVGSNFLTRWGSVGFFGPLTVRPDLWDKGVAKALLEKAMPQFEAWGVKHAGLFTFPQSTKHIALYQRFGFWPRHLTVLMAKPVVETAQTGAWSTIPDTPGPERARLIQQCRVLAESTYPELDLGPEIAAASAQKLGETVVIHDEGELAGFAICHMGPGSEAGSGVMYLKFAAAKPGAAAAARLARLLSACEGLAASRGLRQLMAGVNTTREGAYRLLLEKGYRGAMNGVTMHRGADLAYSRPDCFVLDDWR
jgi:GNAT superfamily N-acetyltransferase